MFYGALFFLIGSGIAVTRCIAGSQEVVAIEICAQRYNFSEDNAGLLMFVTVGADEYEVVADETHKCGSCMNHVFCMTSINKIFFALHLEQCTWAFIIDGGPQNYFYFSLPKCLVDCVAHEAGYLNANDEFTVSEFVEKEKSDDDGKKQEIEEDHKVLFECAETVENWDGWDRKAKCQKGYLFFKCKSFGVDGFKLYMELQRKLATGELKRRGSPIRLDSSSDEDEPNSTSEQSESDGALGTPGERNRNGTEQISSTGHEEPGVTEGLSNRVSGLTLNEAIPPTSQLNTPTNV